MSEISICTGSRDHFVHAPSQWETALHCDVVTFMCILVNGIFLDSGQNSDFCLPMNPPNAYKIRLDSVSFRKRFLYHRRFFKSFPLTNGQWYSALMFPLFTAWTSCWTNNRVETPWPLRDVTVMLALKYWGRDKMAAIFQTTFSNGFSWMKMYGFRLTFHWSLFLGVQFTIFQHWFR